MDATVLSYRQTLAAVTDLFLSDAIRACYVDGQPGIGKTFLSTYIQQLMSLQHRFIIKAGHHDPIDFQGVPVPDHASKMTYFYPSGDLLPPSDLTGGCLMVWDETSDCPQAVQNLLCQAIFEGGLHGYRFPKDTYHYLTGNRVSDKSGAQRVVTKLGNRVGWFTLEPEIDEVFEYGWQSGWNPAVLAFLKLKGGDPINPDEKMKGKELRRVPTFFNSFDPTDTAQLVKPIFASSRSWEAQSKLTHHADKKQMKDGELLVRSAGLISTPVASAFVPFRSEAANMPDPEAILRGDKVPLPAVQSVMWSLTISLVTKVTKTQWKHLDTWLKQKGIPAEFRILCIRMAFDTKAAKLIGPDFNATLQEPDVKQALAAQ